MEELKNYNFNIVFFIPAIKINFYIKFFKKYFLNRKILIAKEMTKLYEHFYREDLKNFEGFKNKIKGELTVVLSKSEVKNNSSSNEINENILRKEVIEYLKRYSLKMW